MKEHPILFSTPMVQAILEGRKTQTRRVIKPQPKIMAFVRHDITRTKVWFDDSVKGQKELKCPYGQPGDLLWVREFEVVSATGKPETCNVEHATTNLQPAT